MTTYSMTWEMWWWKMTAQTRDFQTITYIMVMIHHERSKSSNVDVFKIYKGEFSLVVKRGLYGNSFDKNIFKLLSQWLLNNKFIFNLFKPGYDITHATWPQRERPIKWMLQGFSFFFWNTSLQYQNAWQLNHLKLSPTVLV